MDERGAGEQRGRRPFSLVGEGRSIQGGERLRENVCESNPSLKARATLSRAAPAARALTQHTAAPFAVMQDLQVLEIRVIRFIECSVAMVIRVWFKLSRIPISKVSVPVCLSLSCLVLLLQTCDSAPSQAN